MNHTFTGCEKTNSTRHDGGVPVVLATHIAGITGACDARRILSTGTDGHCPNVVHVESKNQEPLLVLSCGCIVHSNWLATRGVPGKLVDDRPQHVLIVLHFGWHVTEKKDGLQQT
jgi:hypothetical protein